jgi:hypothetical protein
MPPVDLASGDKHAPVKAAAARRPTVAPPSAIGLEVPVVLAGARNRRDTDAAGARHRHAHEPSNVMNSRRPMGSPLADERTRNGKTVTPHRAAHPVRLS